MFNCSKQDIETDRVQQLNNGLMPYQMPENFIRMKDIKLLAPQYGILNAYLHPDYRFIVSVCSRRLGKTYISNLIASLVLLIPGTHVLVISPNYMLSDISFDIQKKELRNLGINIVRENSKDKILELENGSRLRLGSVSRADSTVGVSYDLILFDECALDDKSGDVFLQQLLPALDKDHSKVIFISTPRGRNFFFDFYENGFSDKNWVNLKADYHENDRLSDEVIKQAKAAMSKAVFAQEYLCDFTVKQGRVWELDIEQIYSKQDEQFDFYIAGLDWGFRDYTALVIIGILEDRVHILAEYMDNEKSTGEHAAAIKALVDQYDMDYIYIDSAAQQQRYDLSITYDLSTINAKKDVNLGIDYVSLLVEQGRITVEPGCDEVILAFNNYSWVEASNSRGEYRVEKPKHDRASHMADSIRYALYSSKESIENP